MDQYIVHIDLDFFYGQVEVGLNPSLASLPFAIQQKHIVVTCNYLARKAGVKKLQLLTDAKRICPELIIILGEDIQKYRDASKAIFRHMIALLGDKIQRLGMDELWCDVTEHVLQHECLYPGDWKGTQTLVLNDKDAIKFDLSRGSGHLLGHDMNTIPHRRLKVASHMAAYLRESIRSTFSYTSSAGISCSKLISKLVGDCHKPNDQTLIFPEHHQIFLDTVEVKKIAGIGYVFLKTLYEKIGSDAPPMKRSIEVPSVQAEDTAEELGAPSDLNQTEFDLDQDDGSEFKLVSKEKEDFLNRNQRVLNVLHVRTAVNHTEMTTWFGKDKGNWLFDVLHARDHSLVEPSAMYPKSIGLEDSFLHCVALDDVHERLVELTTELVNRMQGDLVENGKWIRWPNTLRLTPRFRGDHVRGELWRHKRTSRSVPLPVEVFTMTVAPEVRATRLVDTVLIPLFSKIAVDKGAWDLSLLNVGVADFKMSPPAAGLTEYMETVTHKRKLEDRTDLSKCPEGLDCEVWNALDDSTKRQVLRDCKAQTLPEQSRLDKSTAAKKVRFDKFDLEETGRLAQEDYMEMLGAPEEDNAWPDEEEDMGYLCSTCQSVIPSFAVEDHEPCVSRISEV